MTDMEITPPMGEPRPPGDQTCGRLLRYPDEASACGRLAQWHIAWTSHMENGLVCEFHMAEVRGWAFYDRHPITPLCSKTGMRWADSGEHPPGYCFEPVADGIGYLELYAEIPAAGPAQQVGPRPPRVNVDTKTRGGPAVRRHHHLEGADRIAEASR